jgi:hypothetical protein
MPTLFMFVHPDKLNVGEKYYLRDYLVYDPIPKYTEVTFIGYDSSPALVYVVNADENVERCTRTDLFQKLVVVRQPQS